MKQLAQKTELRFGIFLMLVALFVPMGAAPLHELLEHSDETGACATEHDACHAEAELPGISSHPLDDCFDQHIHEQCRLCTALSQTTRSLVAQGTMAPAVEAAPIQLAAHLAVSYPAPATGADLTRGPPRC